MVILQVISGAGHHVYADKSEIFNKHVLEACDLSDSIPNRISPSNIKIELKDDNEQQSSKFKIQNLNRIDSKESDAYQPRTNS